MLSTSDYSMGNNQKPMCHGSSSNSASHGNIALCEEDRQGTRRGTRFPHANVHGRVTNLNFASKTINGEMSAEGMKWLVSFNGRINQKKSQVKDFN